MSSMGQVGLDIASYYIEFVLSGLVHYISLVSSFNFRKSHRVRHDRTFFLSQIVLPSIQLVKT